MTASLIAPVAAAVLALAFMALAAVGGATLARSRNAPANEPDNYRQPEWVAWGEEHGFTDWERHGHSLATFEDDYGPVANQPYPMSQYLVHDAARVDGYYEGHDFTSSVFKDALGTGTRVGGLLEQRLGMAATRDVLSPLLREMETRAWTDDSGQDAALLDRVRRIVQLLDDGFPIYDIIAMLNATPNSEVAILAIRDGVPVEYVTAAAN